MLKDANDVRIRSVPFVVSKEIAVSECFVLTRDIVFVDTDLNAFIQILAQIGKGSHGFVEELREDFFIHLFLFLIAELDRHYLHGIIQSIS